MLKKRLKNAKKPLKTVKKTAFTMPLKLPPFGWTGLPRLNLAGAKNLKKLLKLLWLCHGSFFAYFKLFKQKYY